MTTSNDWQVVIFLIDRKANHAGLSIPAWGLADLSLRGARVASWGAAATPKGDKIFFDIRVDEPDRALEFLRQPGLLMPPIVAREKANKGWHLTREAPDYVRMFRCRRSLDVDDMNCVEWIVRALELGGCEMPIDILTPTDLHDWCRTHLVEHDGPNP